MHKKLKVKIVVICWEVVAIRCVTTMRSTNLHFTYLLAIHCLC